MFLKFARPDLYVGVIFKHFDKKVFEDFFVEDEIFLN
jgi:hypothetical protein